VCALLVVIEFVELAVSIVGMIDAGGVVLNVIEGMAMDDVLATAGGVVENAEACA
jgi:hypothetical protein